MTVFDQTLRRVWLRRTTNAAATPAVTSRPMPIDADVRNQSTFDIAANDPMIAYLQGASGVVELQHLELDSPALAEMRAGGVSLVVPLVAHGELIGLLNVGPRLSDQEYSADDRRLLEALAAQAAPAVRVGQLVREQQAEVRGRERLEQELHVAQLIQQNFLPKRLPDLDGWQVAAFYRPARVIGGDFYDFIDLPDGQIGLVIGDVTDKGIPAAMVMAATRSVLRASAQRLVEPGAVLARVNDHLCPDIPENMFVTCFYGVLDPASGHFRYANAGHNLPLVRSSAGASELRATGMPLGLMPEMEYEERDVTVPSGASVLMYSDGLVEAHDPARQMFGTPRVVDLLGSGRTAQALLDRLLAALDQFTGSEQEQEDDITLVTLKRRVDAGATTELADFTIASAAGNEREVIRRLAEAVASVSLPASRLERLKTAAAELAMNAMEHGNGYDSALDVRIVVAASPSALTVRITDHGGGRPTAAAETPDILAKLDGRQSPRGWGLFLIEQMVDDVKETTDATHHSVELLMRLEEGNDATSQP